LSKLNYLLRYRAELVSVLGEGLMFTSDSGPGSVGFDYTPTVEELVAHGVKVKSMSSNGAIGRHLFRKTLCRRKNTFIHIVSINPLLALNT
jgi:hypothetical protein